MAAPRIAFFDLDKTLISRNSATLWIRAEMADGRLSRLRALHAFTYVVRYSLGLVEIEDTIRRSVTTIAGQREAEMARRAVDFYRARVRPIFRPGGRAVLDAHRAAGDRLVLLTSSSSYVAEQVTRDLALDDYLCSRFEVDADGCYTGRLIEPLCYGRGKLELARRCAAAHGVGLEACAFYTDSIADLPMLEAVGEPAAVHPDPKLRRLARQRGWPVLDWGA
ncbi:HAD family hydrolase [bacterium]|nr:HAD family hydrolase [bacterium]